MAARKFVDIIKDSKLKYWYNEIISIQNRIDSEVSFISPQIDHVDRKELIKYLRFRDFVSKNCRYFHNSVLVDLDFDSNTKLIELFNMYCGIIKMAAEYGGKGYIKKIMDGSVMSNLMKRLSSNMSFFAVKEEERRELGARYTPFEFQERVFRFEHWALRALSEQHDLPILIKTQDGQIIRFGEPVTTYETLFET